MQSSNKSFVYVLSYFELSKYDLDSVEGAMCADLFSGWKDSNI